MTSPSMPVFLFPTAEYELPKFQEFIMMTLPINFISLENIKRKEDLAQSVFVGKVESRIFGKHSEKGQYYRLVLTDLCTDESKGKNSSCSSESKIVAYIYYIFSNSIKINDGDFIALSNADVVPAPSYCTTSKHSHEIVCEDINTDDDLTKPFVWIMTKRSGSPRSSFEDEVKFPSPKSCSRMTKKRSATMLHQSSSQETPSKRSRYVSDETSETLSTDVVDSTVKTVNMRQLIESQLQMKIDSGNISTKRSRISSPNTEDSVWKGKDDDHEAKQISERLKNWVCVVRNIPKRSDYSESDDINQSSINEVHTAGEGSSNNTFKRCEFVDLSTDDESNNQGTQTERESEDLYSLTNRSGVQSVTTSSSLVNIFTSIDNKHKLKLAEAIVPRSKLPFKRLTSNPQVTLPLTTVNAIVKMKSGSKVRVRVKAADMQPELRDDEVPLCVMRCPACAYTEPYKGFHVFVGEVPCPQCPIKAFMQRFFSIQIKIFDRTGSILANVTGSDAGQFFGVTPKEYFTSNRYRTTVRNILHLIYKDTNCNNLLECRNSWLDLVLLVVQTGSDKGYNVVDTTCELSS